MSDRYLVVCEHRASDEELEIIQDDLEKWWQEGPKFIVLNGVKVHKIKGNAMSPRVSGFLGVLAFGLFIAALLVLWGRIAP